MAVTKERPHLSAQAYWGFDNSKLASKEGFEDYTIVRVFERGTSQDIKEVVDFYGKKALNVIVGNAKGLSQRALRVAEMIWPGFDEELERLTVDMVSLKIMPLTANKKRIGGGSSLRKKRRSNGGVKSTRAKVVRRNGAL